MSRPQHRDRPVLFNSWEATHFAVAQEQQGEPARRATAIDVELFVVDDGRFGARISDFRAGLGDWTRNPDRFPQGLKPLADQVHPLGMRFGIWVEPEMVNPFRRCGCAASIHRYRANAAKRAKCIATPRCCATGCAPDSVMTWTPRPSAASRLTLLTELPVMR